MNQSNNLKNIIAHCKEYGFIFPSSEVYDGLSATYDYGPNGVGLKNNLKKLWWNTMTRVYQNIVGIDSAIFLHPTVWKASGHTEAFNDPMIDNRDSKKRYRADVLIEDHITKIKTKLDKEVDKASKKFGNVFDLKTFLSTNPKVLKYQAQIDQIQQKMDYNLEKGNLKELKNLMEELEINDPVSGSKNWTDIRQFNLMFATQMGSISDKTDTIYLRPETAQGIFLNFLNVQKTCRMKPPFGIAQIGKAFRNEIIARQFIFRMKEFEQMEMQFFIKPGTELKWYDYWKNERMKWHLSLGIDAKNYEFRAHTHLAHYANAACDIEYKFPFGFKELEGIHSRKDFDLRSHEKYSGKKLQYYDNTIQKSYTPYVIETSIGLDRLFLAIMCAAYHEETLKDGSRRTVLKIPPALASFSVAILPLLNKEELTKKAEEIIKHIQLDFSHRYDVKDAIGKRYRRQDAIGTPYCITIDHQTLEDGTVTLRERDTMQQVRIPIENINSELDKKTNMKNILSNL